ncbi:MAG: hypothetical protein A2528_03380 [Candidatus Staskawiczbacteria bacterium RIFOXYD2_FULL_37_9]|uniref:Uncharacterized protein n=1 Tax=Candidatus Staskawiczbacteria bacterium RIFOXYB1_FULL_37_44 TaxID=1802223 RepID=A0A1G2IV90_9BACT|nr:MAG: hypothetical protein A2358_02800 [Candidatus Staskawiczbacteria bacterium RIFOXYB1_FULL_37_44]OGZ83853.1 MAG: hypothetical protein A2416_02515 [Candidatus Staskawiczbacteria bacterium RIFOXYC1_FULL_37_52]OGZ89360.1 MAG: hypothetical protein A2581_00575 [Candidatus Staskawiczbacteria bacterium RIFOXYD1_FULL_37_110]OGZ94512.1 MAG: hypothetical protein A2528_03380 [Candidatus Staskawiczbacteria bacterium RIFOXYD2_FULL_37_9]
MLSEERIAKFQALYKKHFGKELSKEDAYEKGAKLVRMVQLVYRPITEKEYQELQKRLNKADEPSSKQGSNTTTK